MHNRVWTEETREAVVGRPGTSAPKSSQGFGNTLKVAASVMTHQHYQLRPSTQLCFCPLLSVPLLTFWTPAFVGVWPLLNHKRRRGLLRGRHECWLACADTTQASAVSSHWLILLPRSPQWSIQRFYDSACYALMRWKLCPCSMHTSTTSSQRHKSSTWVKIHAFFTSQVSLTASMTDKSRLLFSYHYCQTFLICVKH